MLLIEQVIFWYLLPVTRWGVAKKWGEEMRGLLVLFWVFWANMLFLFGVPTIYLLTIRDWRAFVSGPILLLVLFAGWKLAERTRRDWNTTA